MIMLCVNVVQFLDGGKEYQRYGWWPEKAQGKSRDEIIDFSLSAYREEE